MVRFDEFPDEEKDGVFWLVGVVETEGFPLGSDGWTIHRVERFDFDEPIPFGCDAHSIKSRRRYDYVVTKGFSPRSGRPGGSKGTFLQDVRIFGP